jgi:hypothetical protein
MYALTFVATALAVLPFTFAITPECVFLSIASKSFL